MGLSLVTAPASEPITTAIAKRHIRVDITDDDTFIDECIERARTVFETRTRRRLVAQTWDYTLKEFPTWELELPLQPVSSVTYVNYVDSAGSTQTFADTTTSPNTPYWTLLTDGPRSLLIPNYNRDWPATRDHGNAVTVRFVVGYTTIPKDIIQGLCLLVGHYYENREATLAGMDIKDIPMGVLSHWSPYMLRGF